MGKLIQCDRCSKILNPEVDEYSVLTGSDHNYVEVGCAEDVKELHFCSDCIEVVVDAIADCILKRRKGA